VTFDDGLRCQVEHALPVLERLGVPAVFFVAGRPLDEQRPLAVHKVHYLRELLTEGRFEAELERAGVAVEDVSEDDARAHYRYDTPAAARVKYLLNIALPADERERAVDAVFDRVHGDEAGFCAGLYLSPEDVAELERAHSAVGAHSYGHRPLALLDPEERRRDLARCASVLEPLLGSAPRAFSYPHGTRSTVDLASAQDVEAAGFRFAFTMERALNTTLDEPCLLARLDANDAPGGKRPLLELEGDRLVVHEGMSAARTRYFDEDPIPSTV
jgi:peptidoglycan/xylan/chitin deacetylase (PgdA/CDA1 family)